MNTLCKPEQANRPCRCGRPATTKLRFGSHAVDVCESCAGRARQAIRNDLIIREWHHNARTAQNGRQDTVDFFGVIKLDA